MRHLFLTVHEIAFGEVLSGARLASELIAAGDEVVYLAPRAVRPAVDGTGVRFGEIDLAVRAFDRVVASLVRETGAEAVCLVDAVSTFAAFQHRGLALEALFRLPVPLVALDVWDLAKAGAIVDFANGAFEVDARMIALPRVVPVPFATPTAIGAYRALPAARGGDRAARRAALGFGPRDRVVMFPTAAWQHREAVFPATRAIAEAVPPLLLAYLAQVPELKLLHVGPWRLPGHELLGDRYAYHPAMPRGLFEETVAAADVLLSLNAAATTIGTAIAADVPVLLAIHGRAPVVVGPHAAQFLARGIPLAPFQAWPYGMSGFIGRTLTDNPYRDALTTVELLDEGAFLEHLVALLGEGGAEARARCARYRDVIGALPSGRARYAEALSTARSAAS